MRPGPTRVETYCSNDLLKVPRWRRSKLNTAISWLTPPSAALVTPAEIPAADASADMLCTKEWKSPPQRAAWEGVERVRAAAMDAEERTKSTLFMTNHFLPEGRPLKTAACSLIPGLPQQEGMLQPSPMEAKLHAQGIHLRRRIRSNAPVASISRRSQRGATSKPLGQVSAPSSTNTRAKYA